MRGVWTRRCASRETANAEQDKAETPVYQVFIEGGVIRKLWGVERHAYRDHLLRLDAESRHNRFCGTIADGIIRTYAATTRGSDAIVHGFFVDGVLRGVADLRLNRSEAEAAFSIEKPWQSLGIGSALLERSLLAARNRGIKLMEVCCLVENQRMQQLARKFEAELTFDFGTVIGKMENPHPTPLSVMQEMVVDGHSFAAAYVDFQSRLLRRMGALARLPQPCPFQVHFVTTFIETGVFKEKHRPGTVDLGLCAMKRSEASSIIGTACTGIPMEPSPTQDVECRQLGIEAEKPACARLPGYRRVYNRKAAAEISPHGWRRHRGGQLH